MDSSVEAIAVSGTDVYVGGYFTTAGGVSANRIAKWDGTSWSALGTGMNGNVEAIAISGTDIYAGGGFRTAGGVSADRIAKWNGTSWSALGTGMNSNVEAIAVSGADVYAGGYFTTAGCHASGFFGHYNASNISLTPTASPSNTATATASFTPTPTNTASETATNTPTALPTSCWGEQEQLTASDAVPGDDFGRAVAISGDTLVVGEMRGRNSSGVKTGAAYVFTKSGTDWVEQQKLTASDGQLNDFFGAAVAINGDTILIGRGSGTPETQNPAGFAYVFTRSGSIWTQQQKLMGDDIDGLFGSAVAISGDTIAVGASFDDNEAGVWAGSVYVFVRSGISWTLQQRLIPPDAPGLFGFAVGMSDETIIVGSPFGSTPGSAYVFTRNGTVWSEQQKLTPATWNSQDRFGYSVSISDDTSIVGKSNTGNTPGSADIFVRNGTVWSHEQTLVPSDSSQLDRFGNPVSISGNTVIIGATSGWTPSGPANGSAYVFVRSGSAWTQQQKLTDPEPAPSDVFGYALAVSSDTILVGRPYRSTPSGGAAFIFGNACSVATPTSTATNTATPTNTPTPAPGSISGTITYGNAIGDPAVRFVSDAVVWSSAGSPDVLTTTDGAGPTAGQYTLTGFGPGSYTVVAGKADGANSITSFDAAKIAQHVAGTSSLTGNQLLVGDVSNNGIITSFDAAQIAMYAASAPQNGIAGTWKFLPASRDYSSIVGNISGEDYSALLMGEVSGNWTTTGTKPFRQKFGESIAVAVPNVKAQGSKSILVPLRVQDVATKNIISYEFDLRYDPSVIQPLDRPVDVAETVSKGFSVVTNASEPGLLRVAIYGVIPIDENGVLLNLRFGAVGSVGMVSPISLERILFNEGETSVIVTDGHIEIF